jgi:hypothetical protein
LSASHPRCTPTLAAASQSLGSRMKAPTA